MCERVCRAEGILWQGEEHDTLLNMWWEAREGEVSVGVMGRQRGRAEMVMIPHVNITLYQEEIHYRF